MSRLAFSRHFCRQVSSRYLVHCIAYFNYCFFVTSELWVSTSFAICTISSEVVLRHDHVNRDCHFGGGCNGVSALSNHSSLFVTSYNVGVCCSSLFSLLFSNFFNKEINLSEGFYTLLIWLSLAKFLTRTHKDM